MIRRIPLVSLALAAVAVSAGCSTFSDNEAVAKVGDEKLTRDQLDAMLPASDEATSGSAPAGSAPAGTAMPDGVADGDTARDEIYFWAVSRLLTDEVTSNGGEVTDADRTAAEEQLSTAPQFSAATEAGQQVIVQAQAAYTVWAAQLAEQPADEATMRALYELGPEESGIICVSHILVADQAAADDVVAELEGGATFADLAAERSTDPQAAENGGSLGCMAVAQFQQQFVPEFVTGALAAEIGVPTEPVQSEFGWHVIYLQPADEAGEALAELGADPNIQLGVLLRNGDVYVDPRFGSFDGDQVVPLGPPPASAPLEL